MYRDGKELMSATKVNFVLNHGALGDVICSLPPLAFARKMHRPEMKMHVWAPPWQMDLVGALLAPFGEFVIEDVTKFPLKAAQRAEWDGGPVSLNSFPFNIHTRNRVHMVDFAFACLLDAKPESMAERSYPTSTPLGPQKIAGNYIVFPVGSTSENKLIRASTLRPLIEWSLQEGYQPVIVGTKASHTHAETTDRALIPLTVIDDTANIPADLLALCTDMREKTTLLELRDLLGWARAVVGVDGGTLHLAGTTNVPIVYGMGATIPAHRYIPRYADPHYRIRYVGPRDLECAGCQSHMTLLYHHDFRNCPYGDSKCMEALDPRDFIDGLKELGL